MTLCMQPEGCEKQDKEQELFEHMLNGSNFEKWKFIELKVITFNINQRKILFLESIKNAV